MMTTDSPYACGEILSRSLAEQIEPPGFVSFLSQGIAAGGLMTFQFLVWGLVSESAYYGLLFLGALPRYLGIGAVFGSIEAMILWACTYVAGRRLNVAVRTGIALVVLIALRVLIYYIFYEPSPYENPQTQRQFLIYNGLYFSGALMFGLLIGSRIKPLHELTRGIFPARWPVITAITGFLLRAAVVYSLLFSILVVTWASKANSSRKEYVFAVIALSHFVAAAIILFVRMPFWLLLPLAVVINFPIATLITDVLAKDDNFTRTLALNDLVLWVAFLSCRWRITTNEDRNYRRRWFRRQPSDYPSE